MSKVQLLKCKKCNKEYTRANSQIKWRGSSYCSNECKYFAMRGGKIPSTTYVKDIFHFLVKEAAKWVCVRCGEDYSDTKSKLHASHFWQATMANTRFDFENVDALCYSCHYGNKQRGWEFNKQGAYRDFMLKKLGPKKYSALRIRAETAKPLKIAKREFLDWYYEQVDSGKLPNVKKAWPKNKKKLRSIKK